MAMHPYCDIFIIRMVRNSALSGFMHKGEIIPLLYENVFEHLKTYRRGKRGKECDSADNCGGCFCGDVCPDSL